MTKQSLFYTIHGTGENVEELLKIPVADEKELQKKMNKELERIRNSTN